MPSSTRLEVLQGRPAGDAAGGAATRSSPTPPPQASEAGGRAVTTRVMECWNCHGLTYVEFDPDAYHLYVCCHCSAVNRF